MKTETKKSLKGNRVVTLGPKEYILTRISGEYAYIKDMDGCELFIALALLPEGADIGSKLHWENFEYTLVE